MEELVNIIIDNQKISVPKGITILEACKRAGIDLPTLCFLKDINEVGDCRMCIVKVEGRRGFTTACITKVEEGMIIETNTPEIVDARRTILDLIISNHDRDCLVCSRNGNCELQDLAVKFGIQDVEYDGEKMKQEIDDLSPSIVRNNNKCILCRRCVAVCKKVQKVGAIDCANRGIESCISTAGNKSLKDTNCVYCGQCIEACPVNALHEKDNTQDVWEKLRDPEVHVVVQTAPAVRVALGEEFGMPIGTNVTGKMVTALNKLGFDKVFDTNNGADFTIMEEANEFVERFKANDSIPMITSCCPGWIRYIEINYPELVEHLSSCKSPHEMLGSLIKTYYAKKENISPEKIYVVSVMPCIAKKYEAQRKELSNEGLQDVDAVITTRELARMIKHANIRFEVLEDSEFDNPLGSSTGAAAIFGATGGVMEAALRTAQDILTGKDLDKIDFEAVRGEKGIKEATVEINGKVIKVAVASGLGNAQKIMEQIKAEKADYQFVEIMACPGGCVMGGGQPIKNSRIRAEVDVRKLRSDSIYSIDEKSQIRKSHENPDLKRVYEEFLETPGSYRAEKLLHTVHNGVK